MGSEGRRTRSLSALSGENCILGRTLPATPSSARNEGRRRRSRASPPPTPAASVIVVNDSDDEDGHEAGKASSARVPFSDSSDGDSTKDSMAMRSSCRSPVRGEEKSLGSSCSKPNRFVTGNHVNIQVSLPFSSFSASLELVSDSESSTSSSIRAISCAEVEYAGEGPPVEKAPRIDPTRASCVAKRTRSQIGFLARFSYTRFFNDKVLDEEVEEAERREAEEAADDSNPETSDADETEDETRASHLEKPAFAKCENPVCENDVDEPEKDFEFVLTSSDSDGEDELYIGSINKLNSAKRSMYVDGNEEVSREPKKRNISKRKHECVLKDNALHKLLMDSFFSNNDKMPEEHPTQKDNGHHNDGAAGVAEDYPLLFSFEDEDPKPVEKSADVKTLDELWNEFEFALQSVNVGSYDNDELRGNYVCSEGEHQFVLDEEIGIICKYCFFVRLEIKYVLPPLEKHCKESLANRSYAMEDGLSIIKDMCLAKKNVDIGASGRLLETVWDHIPDVDKTLYGHQRETFEFMWKSLEDSIHLDELQGCEGNDHLGGCIISHAPGTGKTRLAIVFIQSYMKHFPDCRPVIIAPTGMLLTWENEFKKWNVDLSVHNLNFIEYSGKENDVMLKLLRKEPHHDKWVWLVKLCSWQRGSSVLVLSYNLFAKLTKGTFARNTDGAIICQTLLNQPELIIFDEGHTPRNDQSVIWQALGRVKTTKRIVLFGTPFQNNLRELFNTLCLVQPRLGKILSNIINPINANDFPNKRWDMSQGRNLRKSARTSLTNNIVDAAKLAELKCTIKSVVHVHNGNVLHTLPGLRECLILLDPLPQQRNIIEKLDNKLAVSFEAQYKLCMASIHPSLVTCTELSEQEKSTMDVHLLEKWKLNPSEGAKTKFVIELVRLSEALNEKVLVFSQYLQPLVLLSNQLSKVFNWNDGKQILLLDGKSPLKSRQSLIDVFNNLASEVRILLASTKTCCEGISLVGASRVVLLDVLWNPSVEKQAICQAYRIGQIKLVYTYQLIMPETGEREKFIKQVEKDKLSEMLFCT